jgi:hypothetical protein
LSARLSPPSLTSKERSDAEERQAPEGNDEGRQGRQEVTRRRQIYAAGRSRPPQLAQEGRQFADMDDAELRAAYRLAFGADPHWKMKRETIVDRLNDPGGHRA